MVRLIVLLAVATSSAVAAQAPPAAPAPGPLTLTASCDAQGQTPMVRLQIANKSAKPTAVVLGFNAANGQTHVVTSVVAITIRAATGADEVHVYVNPKYATAKGPAWIVPLAAGATHDVELPLKDFVSTVSYNGLDPTTASAARIVLEGRPAAGQTMPVWTGKVEAPLAACG